jgi:hypothetical protein
MFFTGLRFSDLSPIHRANITETHINISMQENKTQNHIISLNIIFKGNIGQYRGTIYEPCLDITTKI